MRPDSVLFQNSDDRSMLIGNFHSFGTDDVAADEEFDAIDIIFEEATLKISKWPEGLTRSKHALGGTHGGRVEKHLYRNQSGYIKVQATRVEKEAISGQLYTPLFKQLFDKNQTRKFPILGGLPAMVQEALCNPDLFPTSRNKNLSSKIAKYVKFISVLFQEGTDVIDSTEGANTARYEFFFQSTFNSETPDVSFPCLDPYEFMFVSEDNGFFNQYKKIMDEVIVPLEKVFVEQEGSCYDVLTSPTKSMLVLLAELSVTMLEMHPFQGKIFNSVSKCLGDGDGVFWHVPSDLLVEVSDRDKQFTSIEVGLAANALPLPCIRSADIQRPSAQDNFRVLPQFVQMHQNLANVNKIVLPNVYYKLLGQFLGACWTAVKDNERNGEDGDDQAASFFDTPPYSKLAQLPPEQAKILVETSVKILALGHDHQWRNTIALKTVKRHNLINSQRPPNERTERPTVPAVEDFPTTLNELSNIQNVGVQIDFTEVNSNSMPVIRSASKFVPFFLLFFDFVYQCPPCVSLFRRGSWRESLPRS